LNLKVFFLIFITVFLAELGDKTNITTFLFSTHPEISRVSIFVSATLAFMAASVLSIAAGTLLGNTIPHRIINLITGAIFVLIGLILLISALKGG